MCTICVGKMSHGLNKTLQMCTVKIVSGLKVTNLRKSKSESSKNGLKSGFEYYNSAITILLWKTQLDKTIHDTEKLAFS